jgi:small subunit ribosomal protein S16
LEILGHYNPRTEPATIVVKEDRVYHWVNHGAQLSDGVEQVFRTAGVLGRLERLKAGEDVEILLEEADAAAASVSINPKTRQD